MAEPQPAAGWYPDGAGSMRWWDGTAWTGAVEEPWSTATPAALEASGYPLRRALLIEWLQAS